uniref:PHD finger protein 20 n=1 Tax=Hucho hucho TaxID=62062 RepID=A0A4W5PMD4_9TELE
MSKTPPNRRGITFEVGATLEARDTLKNWYPANIEKIDYDDEKILIHYRQWSHRYDEWFDWTSPYLRPVERIQLRRQGLLDDDPIPGFHVNDKVLASWSDCRFYPAKVLAVNKDASYTVKFYDGVVQTVKGIHVKPFRNGVRKPQNGRDRRPQENVPKNKRARRSTSDQEGDSETEDNNDVDECDKREGQEKTNRKDGEVDVTKESPPTIKQEEHTGQNNLRDHMTATEGPNGVKVEEDRGQSEERSSHNLNGGIKKEVEMKTEYTVLSSPNEPKPSTESPNQMSTLTGPVSIPLPSALSTNDGVEQKAASQPDSSKSAPLDLPVKRKTTLFRKSLSKRTYFQIMEAVTALIFQGSVHISSRQNVYRVIKNQPPPVLSINLDHNPFKCSAVGCTKSFRKAKLLHYHMKYYHGEDQQLEDDLSPTRSVQTQSSEKHPSPTTLESPKRRRTISATMRKCKKGLTLLTLGSLCVTPGLVKERDRLKDKKQTDFLRVKLKKKKKQKKAKSDEDSISDWSTDSCGWSDDEQRAGLDVTTPPLNLGSVALETGAQEIVRCVCEVEEENDFMIQCEECLCWQHGTCMGLLEENVPDKYACYICRDPPGQRQSLRYWYDRDWLSSGHMYGLSFLDENYSHQNAKKIAATHQLLGDIQRVVEVLNGLQLKMSILHTQTHPDLRMWCQPWKRAERPWRRDGSGTGTDAAPSPAPTDEASSSAFSPYQSFQDSYIMSEHCYQKPRAYYPAVEQRLVDSLRSTEDLLEREQRYGGMLETARPKAHTHLNTHTKVSAVSVKMEGGDGDGSSQQHQWQINLLDHIDAVQEEVTHRMDFIERELDVLESWLDYTGELEPPEPLARLPQLKHSMKLLLTELAKVQQIALCCST